MLARVKRGEQINITDRGVVIAKIVPAAPDPLSDRIANGTLRLPVASGPMPHPRGPVRTTGESGDLLNRLRSEERY